MRETFSMRCLDWFFLNLMPWILMASMVGLVVVALVAGLNLWRLREK